MKGSKKSRIPVSKSVVPNSLAAKENPVESSKTKLQSEQPIISKLERNIQRFFIQDIRIFISHSGKRKHESRSFDYNTSAGNEDLSAVPPTTSSPDSGLGESENRPTSQSTHPFNQRMENLKRLALQAKCAEIFAEKNQDTNSSPNTFPQSNDQKMLLSFEPIAQSSLPKNESAPGSKLSTTAVNAGAFLISSLNNNLASPNRIASRGVSFHETSSAELSSDENLAEETAIFPFIDGTVHQAELQPNFVNYIDEDKYPHIDQTDNDSASSTSNDIEAEAYLAKTTIQQDAEKLLKQMNRKLRDHKANKPGARKNAENLCRGPSGNSIGVSKDACSDGQRDEPKYPDEDLIYEGAAELVDLNPNHLDSIGDIEKGMAPDFLREMNDSGRDFEAYTDGFAKSLIDHNSTPILKKKNEIKHANKGVDTMIGSLKRTKRAKTDNEKQSNDACTQTKTTNTEESSTQQGAALDQIEESSAQTEAKSTQQFGTQTRLQKSSNIMATQTLIETPKVRGNKMVQVNAKNETNSKTSQTPHTTKTEYGCQTLSNVMVNSSTQLSPAMRSDSCQTAVKNFKDSASQVERTDISSRRTQTFYTDTKESGFQTDSRIATSYSFNKITQTPGKDTRNCDSQIDSSITGRPEYVQTISNWTRSNHTQTNNLITTSHTTQTDTLFLSKPRYFIPDNPNDESNDRSIEEYVQASNKPGLKSEASELHFEPAVEIPRTSTPTAISGGNLSSASDVPCIDINSPRSNRANPARLKPILKTSASNPGSQLASPTGLNKGDTLNNKANLDDMYARLRDKAMKAKVARTFVEGSPQCSPRESIMNKSNSSINSNSCSTKARISPRTGSLTRQSPDPEDRYKSTNANRAAIGLKPIVTKNRFSATSNSAINSPRSATSSALNSPRDVQIQSRRTGNRVRINEFDIQSKNYNPGSKTNNTNSKETETKNQPPKKHDESGGSTDSLIEELDNLLDK